MMNAETEKIELAKMILDIENPALIHKIKELITNDNSTFSTKLTDKERGEIKLAKQQLDNGQYIEWNDFLKKIGK